MNIINPIPITESMMLGATSITELSATESAWSSSSTAYAVGTIVTYTGTRRRYKCILAHTSNTTTPDTLPANWQDVGPLETLWATGTAYTAGDVVYRVETLHRYKCKVSIGSSTATPETDATYWLDLGPVDVPWKSGVAYVVGDVRVRNTTHRLYKCAVAHTSSLAPELDAARWVDVGPSARWAPFDPYTSTPATALASLTYVLQPGYFNAVALFGVVGSTYLIQVKDSPGGAVIYTATGALYEDPVGWYEYLFSPLRKLTKVVKTGIPLRPNAELTVTVSGSASDTVSLGMLVVGDYVPLAGAGDWGGTQYGSSVEPVSYSYINTAEDGTTTIVRRHSGTNMRARVSMPRSEVDNSLRAIQEVLDIPVAWIATDIAGYQGLSAFGLGSATASYDSFSTGSIEIVVKGLI